MNTTISNPETKKAAKARKLAEQIALFSSLPDCALVALPVVCALKGRSPASIWRDVLAKRIPKPVKAGPRCTRWKVGDLKAALYGDCQSSCRLKFCS